MTRLVRESDLQNLLKAVDTGVADAVNCIHAQRKDIIHLTEIVKHMTKFIERRGYQVYYIDGIPAYHRREKKMRKRRAFLKL